MNCQANGYEPVRDNTDESWSAVVKSPRSVPRSPGTVMKTKAMKKGATARISRREVFGSPGSRTSIATAPPIRAERDTASVSANEMSPTGGHLRHGDRWESQ